MGKRRWMRPALCGVALASMFFYPLAAAAGGQAWYLQWQPRDSVEFAIAFMTLTFLGAISTGLLDRIASPRRAFAGYLVVLLIPAASLVLTMVRGVPYVASFARSSSLGWVQLGVLAIGCLMTIAIAVLKPAAGVAMMRTLLVALSPLVLVIGSGATTFLHAMPRSAELPAAPIVDPQRVPTGHIVVLLFDELSYARIYDGHDIRETLPSIRGFSEHATHYHAATAPGSQTLTSMLGLIAGKRLHDVAVDGDAMVEVFADGRSVPVQIDGANNLFRTARRQGYRTELIGYYLPYCALLGDALDRCTTYSLYNASSVSDAFSPLHAIQTTLILWPRQFPWGLLKSPVIAEHQRQLVERVEAHALQPLEQMATLRVVHFSIPHVPFVFGPNGFDPPLDPLSPSEDLYAGQLQYVDRIAGRVLESVTAQQSGMDTTIVVTSDHEFRARTPADQWSHVPLMVGTEAGSRRDITTPVRLEDVLRSEILGAHTRPVTR